jgi:hypothetical protein
MAATATPSSLPRIRRPACDSTVDLGKPGISSYGIAVHIDLAGERP